MSAKLRNIATCRAVSQTGRGRGATLLLNHGRTPAYRRLSSATTQQYPALQQSRSRLTSSVLFSVRHAQKSQSLFPELYFRQTAFRPFHSVTPQLAKVGKPNTTHYPPPRDPPRQPQPEPREATDQSFAEHPQQQQQPPSPEDETTRGQGETQQEAKQAASQESKAGSEQEGKQESEKSDDETKDETKSKDEEKKDDPPPPPPHGDKTPWQVFTETLSSEFKASKEWNESTKQLAASAHDFSQNPYVQKARQGYTSASDAASTTTAAVLKKSGKAIGQGAAWTWDTPVVRGVRKTANVVGSGLEKATRPIRETDAYKSVKSTIDDGSSSRYGGWVEKEERRKLREAKEAEEALKSGRLDRRQPENAEEDPNAGTNITLHKDAAWKESWRKFKDSSRVMQGLFNMKNTYNESENPLITTARSISDRVAGFFAENETAMVIKKFREMDPSFQLEPFLQEMREYILPEVLDAYVKGDIETLKLWLSAAQYQVYAALMTQYTTAGLKSDGRILDIRAVDVLSARMLDPGDIPVFIITCRTQEVHVYRNAKTGDLAAGMEDKVQQVTYAIGVTRIPEDVNNPETRGWRLIELQKSGRDYY